MFGVIREFRQGMKVANRDNADPSSFEDGTAERRIAELAQESDSEDDFLCLVRDDARIVIKSQTDIDQCIDFYRENYK